MREQLETMHRSLPGVLPHVLGAYNVVMQALELHGLDIECEVIEGTQRDAIMHACGTNALHGIQRTNADKKNAVETMIRNPLVSCDNKGVPWSDRAIARICKVSHPAVAKWRAEIVTGKGDGNQSCVKFIQEPSAVPK